MIGNPCTGKFRATVLSIERGQIGIGGLSFGGSAGIVVVESLAYQNAGLRRVE